MTDLRVEFIDPSPTTIEVRKVQNMSLEGLHIPPDTLSLNFFNHVDGERPEPMSPAYFLSRRPEVFNFLQTAIRFPDFSREAAGWRDQWGVEMFGLVTYVMEDTKYHGAMLIPLMASTALLDRETLRQVWPLPE